ncbi:MAG: adenosylcobalamin-dependent ribonucleoside-diphosphate reductase [Flavobacteriales bacterium]|jgi:ribonucleoside-diphosphate reductase alpha chain|nr:adenosylcobalamin-dependent ribonucleoside-diphosphate reductase [Flavobacteriales bacterium]MBT4881078.1 adenosylcobalamin-dependent ribonucleoside-diphosphate reductase [Flavobacteriales bacterium]
MTTITKKPKDITAKTKKQKTYPYEQVLKAAVAYFNGDELAGTTWMNKYAMKDHDGEFVEQTPDDMHRRMAKEFGRIEADYKLKYNLNGSAKFLSKYGQEREDLTEEKVYAYFKEFGYIIPQGSVMSSLGNHYKLASLSNCIVVPEMHDSYGGVFYTDQQLAQLFKRRCGVGVDISNLRPSGARVSNAAGSTSGAVSFMNRFSNTTREVAQNGRRGALMLSMDIAHPDVEDFITIKQDLQKVTGANISIRLSDEFMNAVEANAEYTHRWPIESDTPKFSKTVNAKELWDTIIECAHNTAEPGLIFWDRQHWYSTSSVYPGYKNTSTNPCSEIAMQGGDSCRLIALNLFNFVENPFTKDAKFKMDDFYKAAYEGQRLMDDLVDLETEAIGRILAKVDGDDEPENIKQVERETWELLLKTGKEGRRTGLGFTALADMVAALGMSIDSDEAIAMVESMMKEKCRAEFDSSIDMSLSRGSFVGFDAKIEKTSEFVQMLEVELPEVYERMMKFGRRNISISTVAPTGTLSMLAQTSSGIEPVFMTHYKRRRKLNEQDREAKVDFIDDSGDKWQEFTVYHHNLKTWMEVTGETDITKSPYAGSTAPEINWNKRVEMQAVVQKYVTHSISSTINLPNDVSLDEVSNIYLESWKQGTKGITVYRDGSRAGVLVSTDDKGKGDVLENTEFRETKAPSRPKRLDAKVVRFQNNKEKWIAVVGLMNGRPYEIFTGKTEDVFNMPAAVEYGWVIKNKREDGSTQYDFQYEDKEGYKVTMGGLSRSFDKEFWNYAKLISGVLRHGMPLHYVVDLIGKMNLYDENINTWKSGVVRALKTFIADGTAVSDHTCGECGDEGLVYEEGCLKCVSCGYSKCG